MTGGDGADTVVLGEGDGSDVITDFTYPRYRLIGLENGLSFSDLTLADTDSGATLLFSEELLATVSGVSANELSSFASV